MYMYVWTYLGLTRCEEAYDGIQPPMVPIVWTPSRGGSPEVYPAGRRGGVRASLGQFRTLDATCACVLGHGAPRSGAAGGGGGDRGRQGARAPGYAPPPQGGGAGGFVVPLGPGGPPRAPGPPPPPRCAAPWRPMSKHTCTCRI